MIFKFIKDILAPKKCYSCNIEGYFLCPYCIDKISIFEAVCYSCKGNTDNFSVHNNCLTDVYYDKIIIMGHYKNKILNKLIKDFKFYNRKDIGEDFGNYLAELFFNNEVYKNTDNYILVFPPMGFFKKIKRGYNQAEIITKTISNKTGIKIENNLIKKIKTTRQQSKLNRQERIKNLKNSFIVNKNKVDIVDNKIFIIVDDVVSTGTTINEIAKALKLNGAKKVIGLIVASD